MRVFVCHASEDKPRVRELCRRLQEDGVETWLDEDRLLPGQDWELQIAAAVRESDAVLVCLSQAAVEKVGYLQKELRRVLDAAEYQPEGRIFVIPVRLEECQVPIRLSQWQHADLFAEGGYERLRRSLLEKNAEERNRESLPGSPVEPPRPRVPKTGRAISLAAIAVSAAVIVALTLRPGPKPNPPETPKQEETPAGMVTVPGGHFLMGRDGFTDQDASPAHEVEVKPFYIDKVPVTNANFREWYSNRATGWPDETAAGSDNWPATRVTWDEAHDYCRDQGKRLPKEEEWEFAARGDDGRLYPWGDKFDPAAVNNLDAGIGHPEPVGSRANNRSPFGVADMSGNVWQWCFDEYRRYGGGGESGAKVIRGGSFKSDRQHVMAITRNLEVPSKRSPVIGFRCAK